MFTGFPQLASQDVRKISTSKQHSLGTVGVTRDGRVYRYTRAGGTTLDPGKITVAATVDTNVTNKAVSAASAIGSFQVQFTAGSTVTADAYVDGTLNVNDATGEGITYLIAGHLTTAAQVVTLAEPITVALVDATSEVTMTKNPWADTVISIADQLDMPVGIPNVTITNAYYGWTQTRGVCAALADETLPVGSELVVGGSTVGAVEERDTDETKADVGIAIVAGVDTEYREIFLTID